MKDEKKTCGSTNERLTLEGYAPEQSLQVRAKISVSENGKRYMLTTNGQEESEWAKGQAHDSIQAHSFGRQVHVSIRLK